ncbi:MAG: IS21-like element helper ATPase IstB [Nitrospinota bacterium]
MTDKTHENPDLLKQQLRYLKLPYMEEQHETVAEKAAEKDWTHIQYLENLVLEETRAKQDRAIQRRIRLAGFPVLKTIDQFQWSWPKKVNRLQVQDLFRLAFVSKRENVVLLGGVGLGKTHIASALGYEACLKGHSTLFASAIDVINTLNAAKNAGRLKLELKKYLKPELLILDELGYLPIDKAGADLLFQVISGRYEQGATIITSNRVYKQWPEIFNNDATLTSAILDRVLHHAQTVIIEGKSYRMKDKN